METKNNFRKRIIELFEDYSVDYSEYQKKALEQGVNPNQLPSFVPWAKIDGKGVPMVGKQDDTELYYGYDSEEKAKQMINKTRKLPGWQKAESFWIEVMFGKDVVDYLEF